VCCERNDASTTRRLFDVGLDAALSRNASLVVRIDPRDTSSDVVLETAADAWVACGRALPDIVIAELNDTSDDAVIQLVDDVVVGGRRMYAMATHARWRERGVIIAESDAQPRRYAA
jgi:hypothetical protein